RTQPAASGNERWWREERTLGRVILQRQAALAIGGVKRHAALRVGRVTRRETMSLVGRHKKVGVVHFKRIEDTFLEKLLERLAADFSDEIADDIGGNGIIPGLAGREFQRDLCKILDHRLQRSRFYDLADLHLAIGGIHVGALLEAVSEAGSMPQKVYDQHWPRRRPGQECRRRAGLE